MIATGEDGFDGLATPAPVAVTVCPGVMFAVTKPRWKILVPENEYAVSAPFVNDALFGSLSVTLIVAADAAMTL